MTFRAGALACCACVLTFAGVARQIASAQTATAVIAGRVVSDDGNQTPIRRAVVTLTGVEVPRPQAAITDGEGRFQFSGLPAGRFMVAASKAPFIDSAFGARVPGRPGTALTLAAGQRVEGATIVLGRGAVIAGTVRDEAGDVAPDVSVSALRILRTGDVAAPVTAVTDDRGNYRIFGLQPGEYLVAVVPRTTGGGSIGRLSPGEIDAVLSAAQAGRNARPIGASPPPGESRNMSPGRVQQGYSYAATFYPGTAIAAQAIRVPVVSGQERTGVDVSLTLTSTASIEGTVTSSEGAPANVSLVIDPDGPRLPSEFGVGARPTLAIRPSPQSYPVTAAVAAGRFRYANVAPGRYRLRATGLNSSGQPVWARSDVTIVAADVDNVAMVLVPAPTVSGRIERGLLATSLENLRVNVRALASEGPDLGGAVFAAAGIAQVGARIANVRADGTFEATGVLPGQHQISVMGLPAGWIVRSASYSGGDALDTVLTVGESNLTDLVLTLSDRHTELSGTLQLPTGQPAADFYVIVFPVDRALRLPGRRIHGVRPATDGRYVVRDLPPGDYLIAAVTDAESDEWNDPAFLETLVPAAVKLTVRADSNSSLDLRIAR